MANDKALFPSRKEDYQVNINITGVDGFQIENLRCKFYLPEKHTGRVKMFILPTSEQGRTIDGFYNGLWRFSFVAKQPSLVGQPEDATRQLQIRANEVYSLGISTRMWGPDVEEVVWRAEPVDLTIVDVLEPFPHPTEGRFWLTPSFVLSPGAMVKRSYTGDVEVKKVREKQFELANGLSLNFAKHFRSKEQGDGSVLVTNYLVAESSLWDNPEGSTIIDDTLLEWIDDFLLVASLATRERCVCVGWEVYDQIGHTRFYRRRISIPKNFKKHDYNEDLIDAQNYENFIQTIYPKFANDESIELVRDVVRSAIPLARSTLESRFTSLFSAVETLVLSFRRKHRLEFVFTDESDVTEWKKIKDVALPEWLKAQQLLSGEDRADQRKLIYENLSALERISFGHAFKKFCEYYNADLSDLWPITGGGESKWSLTTIRNKLVHGEVLPSFKIGALQDATLHLQWTLERLILGYFGWEVAKSNVSKAYLSQFLYAHKRMETERKTISS